MIRNTKNEEIDLKKMVNQLLNRVDGLENRLVKSEEEIDSLIKKHKPVLGEPKINRKLFDHHINKIKERGYDEMPSETTVGVTNIAFPIFDPHGKTVAVLSCPYLKRIDDFKVPRKAEVVKIIGQFAKELTELYGGKEVRRIDMHNENT